jgi:hypothetical protein
MELLPYQQLGTLLWITGATASASITVQTAATYTVLCGG